MKDDPRKGLHLIRMDLETFEEIERQEAAFIDDLAEQINIHLHESGKRFCQAQNPEAQAMEMVRMLAFKNALAKLPETCVKRAMAELEAALKR